MEIFTTGTVGALGAAGHLAAASGSPRLRVRVRPGDTPLVPTATPAAHAVPVAERFLV